MNPLVLSFTLAAFTAGFAARVETLRNESARPASDSAMVIGTVSQFHDALASGDTAAIKRLIAPDLRVLEAGEVENRLQYLSSHLAADMQFAKSVRSERTVVSYKRQGDVAWVISTSTDVGKFRDREINSAGAESMILSRSKKSWQIRVVHWSSARRR